MSITYGLAVYFMIWWIVLFAILPFGLHKTQEEAGDVIPGSVSSAPERPKFLKVVVMTTVTATVLFGAYYWLRQSGITLADLPFPAPPSLR